MFLNRVIVRSILEAAIRQRGVGRATRREQCGAVPRVTLGSNEHLRVTDRVCFKYLVHLNEMQLLVVEVGGS